MQPDRHLAFCIQLFSGPVPFSVGLHFPWHLHCPQVDQASEIDAYLCSLVEAGDASCNMATAATCVSDNAEVLAAGPYECAR